MSYEIVGESIKSAISLKLGELFDNPYRYKENITRQSYPNFQIIQVNTNVTPLQTTAERIYNKSYKRIQIDYLMNIQYRVAEDTEEVTNLRQQLDAVGLKLLAEFNDINLELPVHLKNKRYEIVDGILQFFTNITVFANIDEQNDTIMNNINLQENLEEEE